MLRRSVLFGVLVAVLLVLALAGPALAFTDVPTYDPYAKAIDNLSTRGIINGFDDGTFRPKDVVTPSAVRQDDREDPRSRGFRTRRLHLSRRQHRSGFHRSPLSGQLHSRRGRSPDHQRLR